MKLQYDLALQSAKDIVSKAPILYPSASKIEVGTYVSTIGIHRPLPSKVMRQAWGDVLDQTGSTSEEIEKHFHNFQDLCASPGQIVAPCTYPYEIFIIVEVPEGRKAIILHNCCSLPGASGSPVLSQEDFTFVGIRTKKYISSLLLILLSLDVGGWNTSDLMNPNTKELLCDPNYSKFFIILL
jgi:hypothetical protein